MKKELKDYLHLYLGCEVKTENGLGRLCMVGILGNDSQRYHVLIGGMSSSQPFNFNKDKLILRHLSDMTEEEGIELFKQLSLFDLTDCIFDFIEDESSVCINAELKGRVIDSIDMDSYRGYPAVRMMNNDGSFSPVSNQQDVFLFLLSKHFDLFGLIESGLAIDKTTLK